MSPALLIKDEVITLEGKTLKGKNRVREHGIKWIIVDRQEKVLFSPYLGPWFLIKPESSKSGYMRWIHFRDDEHFAIITSV